MNIEAYIVHLKRAEQRRPQVERIIAACPLKAQVLDAVDGGVMSEAERGNVYRFEKLFEPRYPFRIGPGEIGCFLSHRKAWQKIVDDGLDSGLIIEDDVEIDAGNFPIALDLASRHIGKTGMIQFQVRKIANPGPMIAENGRFRLFCPRRVPLRLSCTLFSRAAAIRLLELTETFDRPVDGFMQLTWVTGIRPAIAVPSGVSDMSSSVGGTTIQNKGASFALRVSREFLRTIYRWRISRLSEKSAP